MATTAHLPSYSSVNHVIFAPFRAVSSALELIRSANRAARDYEQLSHLSDANLAKMGLTREGLPRFIAERAELF